MKIIKITLASLLFLTTSSFSANEEIKVKEYNLKKVFLGKNSFMGLGKMVIKISEDETTTIPLVITSKVLNIHKESENNITIIDTELTISLRPRKGPKIDTVTKSSTSMNSYMQVINYIEETTSPEGIKRIECKTENPIVNKKYNFIYKIGDKSPTEKLSCSDGTKRTMSFKLIKSSKKGHAIISLNTRLIGKVDKNNLNGTENSEILINSQSKIISIKSDIVLGKLFTMKYKSTDILQR